jgi:hypothetical protein
MSGYLARKRTNCDWADVVFLRSKASFLLDFPGARLQAMRGRLE